jgi:hypothetical protein
MGAANSTIALGNLVIGRRKMAARVIGLEGLEEMTRQPENEAYFPKIALRLCLPKDERTIPLTKALLLVIFVSAGQQDLCKEKN